MCLPCIVPNGLGRILLFFFSLKQKIYLRYKTYICILIEAMSLEGSLHITKSKGRVTFPFKYKNTLFLYLKYPLFLYFSKQKLPSLFPPPPMHTQLLTTVSFQKFQPVKLSSFSFCIYKFFYINTYRKDLVYWSFCDEFIYTYTQYIYMHAYIHTHTKESR